MYNRYFFTSPDANALKGCIYTTLLLMGYKNKNTYFDWVREKERKRGKREMGEKTENWFVYIICWYSLYYFNELYVKIKTRMLGKF